jgi:O-acetyl-ADP-ribose deacetylase (regulator of RNase III)
MARQEVVMDKQNMRFLFGDRELILMAGDLLDAQLAVIVSPNDTALSGSNGLALRFRQAAGGQLVAQCEQLIREYGRIEEGMAVYTDAGELPYRAVIHAVVPSRDSDDQQHLLEQALSRSLQLCELNEWRSIGFPDFADDCDNEAIHTCARAFFRAITRFWDARYESPLGKVVIYVHPDRFRVFFDAFRADGLETDINEPRQQPDEGGESVGQVSLNEADIEKLNDSDIDDWFK